MKIAPYFSVRDSRWETWKDELTRRVGVYQHEETAEEILMWFYDGPEVHLCRIYKGEVPETIRGVYSQAQNDADREEWLTDFVGGSNRAIQRKEADGRASVKVEPVASGRRYNIRAFSFSTSSPGSLAARNALGQTQADLLMMCFDEDGTLLTGPDFSSAVRTRIRFEPTIDIEIVGGWLDMMDAVFNSEPGIWYFSVTAAPDIPPEYGGSLSSVDMVDLGLLTSQRVSIDPRTPDLLRYDPMYHSGALAFDIHHPAGIVEPMQIVLEIYK